MYTIHGLEVVNHARCRHRDGNRPSNVVLVDCGENAFQRWCTALHCDGDESLWAHVFELGGGGAGGGGRRRLRRLP